MEPTDTRAWALSEPDSALEWRTAYLTWRRQLNPNQAWSCWEAWVSWLSVRDRMKGWTAMEWQPGR
jgi:hypothetical protein